MLQHSAWTALEAKGLGANLQHYNLVNEEIAKTWNLPATWRLKSQLVFGGRTGEPGEKTFKPLSEKLKVFGA
jgi:predicted oxidoreductase (fatty acid repression mutant protein)